jgi:hypothetical protein
MKNRLNNASALPTPGGNVKSLNTVLEMPACEYLDNIPMFVDGEDGEEMDQT